MTHSSDELPLERLSTGTRLWIYSLVIGMAGLGLLLWCQFHIEMHHIYDVPLPPIGIYFPAGSFQMGVHVGLPENWPDFQSLFLVDTKFMLGCGMLIPSWLAFAFACWCLGVSDERRRSLLVSWMVRWETPVLLIAGLACSPLQIHPRFEFVIRSIDPLFALALAGQFWLIRRRFDDFWLGLIGDAILLVAAMFCTTMLTLTFFDLYSLHSHPSRTKLPLLVPPLLGFLNVLFIFRLRAVIASTRKKVESDQHDASAQLIAPASPPG
jgi:hypothetical protein